MHPLPEVRLRLDVGNLLPELGPRHSPWYEFGNTTGPTPQELGVILPSGALSDPEGTVDLGDTNFQHDFPYFVQVSIDPRTGATADAYRHYNTNDINWFINDDWKVSRRLTLNLGVRYSF